MSSRPVSIVVVEDAARDDALTAYRAALVEMDAIGLDKGPRRWNRLTHRVQRAHLVLRETAEGRRAILDLVDDPVPTVALWAATHALFWDRERSANRLRDFVSAGGLGGFEAKITLQEFEAGRLHHDWQPPRWR